MSWNDDNQKRLNALRAGELAGTLTEPERHELAALMAMVEADEAEALAPYLGRLQAESHNLNAELRDLESENQELARLLAQQQALAADARHFLSEFDQRRSTILEALAHFSRGPLPTT